MPEYEVRYEDAVSMVSEGICPRCRGPLGDRRLVGGQLCAYCWSCDVYMGVEQGELYIASGPQAQIAGDLPADTFWRKGSAQIGPGRGELRVL